MGEIQNNAGFTVWHFRVFAGMLLCFAAAEAAWGQCEPVWTQRFDVPAARVRPAMAYDAGREVVVMFAGDNDVPGDDETFRQLWEWDGASWTRRTDVIGGPQDRVDWVEMVYDSWRGVLVVRVRKPQGAPAETWEFDGNNWSLHTTAGPQGTSASMAFDSRRGVTVLWRSAGTGTWEWDGTLWTFRDPGPVEVGGFELAFDENRGVTVAFGLGENNEVQTWEWYGTTWALRADGGPPRRVNQALAYDVRRAVVLLYGGRIANIVFDDTWAWDGTSWELVTAGEPGERDTHAVVYDAARGEMVVFGGKPENDVFLSDTWTFDGGSWSRADDPGLFTNLLRVA